MSLLFAASMQAEAADRRAGVLRLTGVRKLQYASLSGGFSCRVVHLMAALRLSLQVAAFPRRESRGRFFRFGTLRRLWGSACLDGIEEGFVTLWASFWSLECAAACALCESHMGFEFWRLPGLLGVCVRW